MTTTTAATSRRPRRLRRRSAHRLDDLLGELRELLEVLHALGLQPLDDRAVIVGTALPLVEPRGLELLGVVQTGNRRRDLVAEVRVLVERDRALGDPADARGRVGDPQLLRTIIAVL